MVYRIQKPLRGPSIIITLDAHTLQRSNVVLALESKNVCTEKKEDIQQNIRV